MLQYEIIEISVILQSGRILEIKLKLDDEIIITIELV